MPECRVAFGVPLGCPSRFCYAGILVLRQAKVRRFTGENYAVFRCIAMSIRKMKGELGALHSSLSRVKQSALAVGAIFTWDAQVQSRVDFARIAMAFKQFWAGRNSTFTTILSEIHRDSQETELLPRPQHSKRSKMRKVGFKVNGLSKEAILHSVLSYPERTVANGSQNHNQKRFKFLQTSPSRHV